MKNKLFYLLLFLMGYIISTMAFQVFLDGTVKVTSILSALIGILIAALIILKPKNSLVRLIAVVLVALTVPIMLIGLFFLVANLLSLNLPTWTMFIIYVVGFITILLLLLLRPKESLLFKGPNLDERNYFYYMMSGFAAFIFLNFLIICSLLQPWLTLDDLRLWVGVLIAGQIFWVGIASFLELKK